jgi:hypothetical protein
MKSSSKDKGYGIIGPIRTQGGNHVLTSRLLKLGNKFSQIYNRNKFFKKYSIKLLFFGSNNKKHGCQ